jgi:hypothetical protein
MKTRIAALIVVLSLLLPSSAYALETNELVAIAAMPLAVAAVSDLTDVPTNDLVTVVSAMNRASVPPPQFIEVVRYAPVALVDRSEPTFVTYVTTQVDRGLVGDALALSLADRLSNAYSVREIDVVNPQTVYVVEQQQFVPTVVTTRLQTVSTTRFDPIALVAMPLAVAAVANLSDVPTNDLISFISALNQASMPAPQFVEVVRYSPVMLIDDTIEPQFVRFVTTEADRGIRGETLAIAIADRFHTIGIRDIDVVRPVPVLVERTEFIPPVVHTRIAEVRTHPHGGPPGQLKKQLGVQTGAEVVHGAAPRTVVVTREAEPRSRGKAKVTTRVKPQPSKGRSKAVKPEKRGNNFVSAPASRGSVRETRVSAPPRRQPVMRPAGKERGRGNAQGNSARGNAGGKGKGKGKGNG